MDKEAARRQFKQAKELKLIFKPRKLGLKFNGYYVRRVTPGYQPARCGVKIGWKVLRINGQTMINDAGTIKKVISQAKDALKPIEFVFLPNVQEEKEDKKTDKKADERKKSEEPDVDEKEKAREIKLTFTCRKLGIKFERNMVTMVSQGHQGERSGVKMGWKILSVNGKAMGTEKGGVKKALKLIKESRRDFEIVFLPHVLQSLERVCRLGHEMMFFVIPWKYSCDLCWQDLPAGTQLMYCKKCRTANCERCCMENVAKKEEKEKAMDTQEHPPETEEEKQSEYEGDEGDEGDECDEGDEGDEGEEGDSEGEEVDIN